MIADYPAELRQTYFHLIGIGSTRGAAGQLAELPLLPDGQAQPEIAVEDPRRGRCRRFAVARIHRPAF